MRLSPAATLFAALSATACSASSLTSIALWDKTVAPYLQKDLSSDAESYDATNFLMLPLHAAFELSSAPPAWKMQFSDNFALWAADGYPEASNHLNRLQYLYLPSRFLVLSYRHQQKNLVTHSLPNALFAQVRDLWLTLPAGQWNHADFPGIKARLQYKHSLTNPAKSYFQGIVDEDFFLFAIAADLKAVRNMAPSEHPEWDPVLDDILASAHQVFGEYGVLEPDGGWLMQPGVYWDHPDYVYAGDPHMFEGMPQAPIRFISMDTPHVHRMPLWLSSLAEAYKAGDARRGYYHAIKQRLSVQFSKHALVPPDTSAPFWKTTNYLDGVNGVYRWHYATTSGSGYGPYEGSGAMTLGWWSFLHTTPVRDLYQGLAEAFPLKADAIATYVGPNTSRKRNPLVTEPACYTNGFRELLSRLAYQQTFQQAQDDIN